MSERALTREVAAWLSGLQPGDVPTPVGEALRLLALDTMGAGLAGRDLPWSRAVRSWALAAAAGPASHGRARLWGERDAVLRASDAALVNGVAAHAFELDDFHNAKLHPGAVVVPAALALGEAIDAPGDRLLTAIAAGYEIMIRSSLALGPAAARARGWHLTAICGTFGAAAAASVLLGLDAATTANALGLAGTQSGGTFAFNADGSASKRLHAGRAAQSGIMAAEMAKLGLTGPTSIYEFDDGGFLKTFVGEGRPERLVDGLGTRWHAADTNFKPYSCCGSLHAHVDAALQLRPRWRRGGRVRVGMAGLIDRQCGYPYDAGSELNAQMSTRYCVAAALLDGAVLPAQFTASRIADPEITRLAKAIELVHEPAHDSLYPEHFVGWTEVETDAGSLERIEVPSPSGSPRNPTMRDSLQSKFRSLVGPIVGSDGVAALEAAFTALPAGSASGLLDRAVIPLRAAAAE